MPSTVPPTTVQFGLSTLPILLFQFMPVILFGVLSFLSLLNQDMRSLIYSIGLFIASVGAILLSPSIGKFFAPPDLKNTCTNAFMLTETKPLSEHISLNLIMYTYTFGYFITAMVKRSTVRENIPIILFFTSLIIAEFIWSIRCYSHLFYGVGVNIGSIVLGGLFGVAWAFIILSMKQDQLLYLTGLGTRETCSAPSNQRFVCKYKERSRA